MYTGLPFACRRRKVAAVNDIFTNTGSDMARTALLFPGQGSQYVGMAKDVCGAFPEARHVIEEIEECLKTKLSKVMFEGPEEAIRLTVNTQPALMAASIAIMTVLEKQGNIREKENPAFYAGHSLGEYSALCAAGSFTAGDAANALRTRGEAMQKAVPEGRGAMLALLGAEADKAETVAQKAAQISGAVCELANDNGGGQCVLSGATPAIDAAETVAKEEGVKKAVRLAVSAPFHCSLMRPAADKMRACLDGIDLSAPSVPVVANVTAQAETDPDRLKDLLIQQVTGRVRWRESVLYMKEQGVTRYVEIGAGKVLSGLVKRIDRGAETVSVQNCADIDAYLNTVAA